MKTYYVYTLTNSLDGKVFYVGKGTGDRVNQHVRAAKRGCQYHVHRKIRKIESYGGQIFPKVVFESGVEQDALVEEMRLIEFYGRENLTNLTDGGEGSSGYKHTAEVKEKLRQAKIGKKLSEESIALRQMTRKSRNIPAWNKGKRMSEEFRKKVSAAGIGRIPWNKGKHVSETIRKKIINGLTGRPVSEKSRRTFIEMASRPKTEEHRRKISESKIGKPRSKESIEKGAEKIRGKKHSEEWRRHQSESLTGRVLSEEHRLKLRKSKSKKRE